MKHVNLHRQGFTLIELLIVIALLGALAIGLLATIDPFEQLKKGRDTSNRNTTAEFYNANLRYYATRGMFPWGQNGLSAATSIYALSSDVALLVSAGELKDKFMELAGTGNLNRIVVQSTDATHMSVCFQPESKSFQVDLNTVYSSDGLSGTDCKALGGSSDCFYCIK